MNKSPFIVRTASVAGPHHQSSGMPNQDAAFYRVSNGTLILAVADGAGSLSQSHRGAATAVVAAINESESHLSSEELQNIPRFAIESAIDAQKAYEDYKEYGSTLVVVALSETGEWAAGAVGDSFAVIHGEPGDHELITGTPSGEYANITELLTSIDPTPVYASGDGAVGVSLSSDGLESVAIAAGEAHPGFWNGVVAKSLKNDFDPQRLIDWLSSLSRITDDTTLLTAVRK